LKTKNFEDKIMDIQATLTLVIEVVFWGFVSLIIFDFTNRLFALDVNTASAFSFTQPEVISQPIPEGTLPAIQTPQFEQIPDPWEKLTLLDSPAETQLVVLTFPTLRLLPPAQKAPQKSKRTKKAASKTISTKAESSRKPGRPRKKAA
jgi:hypothetical protein